MKAKLPLIFLASLVAMTTSARAQETPGVTANEIKIGQTMPYSGPGSAYGFIGRLHAAFFKMINEQGGINGRKLTLVSLDDGFSPPKTMERTRELVENEGVAFIFGNVGTATNSAIQKYLNVNKVPQLFIATGAEKWADPEKFPWTISILLSYRLEGRIFAKYILKERPNAKVAVLYQNDDLGKDYLAGLKDVFGDRYSQIVVKEAAYQLTDPTVNSQIATLKASGADTLVTAALAKGAAQTIRKVYELDWKPLHLLSYTSQSTGTVINPAGTEKAIGIVSSNYIKDPDDPTWKNDPGMNQWRQFMAKYLPGEPLDPILISTYTSDLALIDVLKRCGNDLSRENIMKQATDIRDLELAPLLPGIKLNSSPKNYHMIRKTQMMRWDGTKWIPIGDVTGVD